MNSICKVIWSHVHQKMVVVSEIARSGSKSHSSRTRLVSAKHLRHLALAGPKPSALSFALALGLGLSAAHAQLAPSALPVGGSIAAGTATITQHGSSMQVNQSSQRAVINWQSFNVGSDAQLQFNNGTGSTLNRVTGPDASTVLGRITATGQVIVSNGNGVYFGKGSRIDVGSFVATTHSISNDAFMAGGHLRFERNGSTASVVNEGEISARLQGFVALLAPEVRNGGVVIARKGTVALAAGEAITLQINANDRLEGVVVEAGDWRALVDNQHVVEAEGGLVLLSARALHAVQGGVVRHSGSINVSSLTEAGGRVLLTGDDLTLAAGSAINATGAKGGGQVLVGGDWQGGQNAERRVLGDPNAVHQATSVTMARTAVIDASATDNGKGGTVVLWSDVHSGQSITTANGAIYARGGIHGGDGGQIETSGAAVNTTDIRVDASARARQGKPGLWLIDPYDYVIDSTAAANIVDVLNTGTDVAVSTATSDSAYGGSASTGTGNITVSSAISADTSKSSSLSLIADNDIKVNAGISVGGNLVLKAGSNIVVAADGVGNTNVTVQTNGGKIDFWADSDGSGQGSIALGRENHTTQGFILSNGGNITFAGGADFSTGYAMAGTEIYPGANTAGGITGKPRAGFANFGYTVDASGATTGGDITIRGDSSTSTASTRAVLIETNRSYRAHLKTNNAGMVHITGDGSRSTGVNPWGIALNTADISTENGDISLSGKANTAIGNARGVAIVNFNITSTGGNVVVTDVTDGSAANYSGTYINAGNSGSSMTSGAGKAITVTADEIVFENGVSGYTWFKTGDVTIKPYTGASFTGNLALRRIKTDTSTSFVVGKDGVQENTAAVTLEASTPLSVQGPIDIYGGSITLNSSVC